MQSGLLRRAHAPAHPKAVLKEQQINESICQRGISRQSSAKQGHRSQDTAVGTLNAPSGGRGGSFDQTCERRERLTALLLYLSHLVELMRGGPSVRKRM